MYEKLTICPNFTWYMTEKLTKFPILNDICLKNISGFFFLGGGGGQLSPCLRLLRLCSFLRDAVKYWRSVIQNFAVIVIVLILSYAFFLYPHQVATLVFPVLPHTFIFSPSSLSPLAGRFPTIGWLRPIHTHTDLSGKKSRSSLSADKSVCLNGPLNPRHN